MIIQYNAAIRNRYAPFFLGHPVQFSIDNISLSRESTENLDLIVFCLRKISQIWVFNNLWIFNQVEPPPGVNIWSVNRWSTFRGKPISRLFDPCWKRFNMNILQISPFLAHLPSVNGCGSLKSSCVERTVHSPSPFVSHDGKTFTFTSWKVFL